MLLCREKRLSPRRASASGGSLLPLSPRTNPGSPKTTPVPSVWPSPDLLPPPRRPLQRKSTVCGLNSRCPLAAQLEMLLAVHLAGIFYIRWSKLGNAPIGNQVDAGAVTTVVGSQEENGLRHFLSAAQACQRDHLREARLHSFRFF